MDSTEPRGSPAELIVPPWAQRMKPTVEDTSAQQTDRLSVLHEYSEALTRTLDYDELLRAVLSALRRLVPCDVAAVALGADPEPRLLLTETRALADGVREQAQSIVCGAFHRLTGAGVPAAQIQYERARGEGDGRQAVGDIQSIHTASLSIGKEITGVVCVLSLQANAFTLDAACLVETVANQAAMALAHIRMRPMAQQWPLEPLLEGVSDPLLLLSPTGEILARNSGAEALLPLLVNDAVQNGPIRRLECPRLQQALADLFAGRDEVAVDLAVRNGSRPRILAVRLTRLASASGRASALAHLRDVTYERAVQEHVVRNARLAAIGELTASMAHELNNPLTIILGFADLLLLAQLPDEAMDNIGKIHAAALRSRKITQDVLSFARGGSPGMTIFDLNEALRLPIRLVGKHFRADNIEIAEAFQLTVPPVHGDMGQLQQVVLNLLQNAHYAITSSGVGCLVVVATRSCNGSAVIDVKDDGPGMPEEVQQRIFEPFFTTKPTGEGTGLGLSIARSIVERHGGTISVASRRSGGTCFTIELPVEAVHGRGSFDEGDATQWAEDREVAEGNGTRAVSATAHQPHGSGG